MPREVKPLLRSYKLVSGKNLQTEPPALQLWLYPWLQGTFCPPPSCSKTRCFNTSKTSFVTACLSSQLGSQSKWENVYQKKNQSVLATYLLVITTQINLTSRASNRTKVSSKAVKKNFFKFSHAYITLSFYWNSISYSLITGAVNWLSISSSSAQCPEAVKAGKKLSGVHSKVTCSLILLEAFIYFLLCSFNPFIQCLPSVSLSLLNPS